MTNSLSWNNSRPTQCIRRKILNRCVSDLLKKCQTGHGEAIRSYKQAGSPQYFGTVCTLLVFVQGCSYCGAHHTQMLSACFLGCGVRFQICFLCLLQGGIKHLRMGVSICSCGICPSQLCFLRFVSEVLHVSWRQVSACSLKSFL